MYPTGLYSREQRAKWLLADIWRLPRGSNTPLLAEGYLIMKYKDIATGKILAHLQYMLDRMINEMYNLIVLQV